MKPRPFCGPLTWLGLRALRRTGLLPHLNFTVKARMHGRSLPVPVRAGVGLYLLMDSEPWMEPLMRTLLERFPGVFVDVGVNVGQTLCTVKALDPHRHYVGFEPNPVCAYYASELTLLHGYAECTVVPVGLSDRDMILSLELHNEVMDDSSATTVQDFRPGQKVHRRITVPVMQYATAVRDLAIGTMGILKIDVEGGEREVLLGSEQQLASDRPAVILEILPVGARTARLPRQQDVEALFARNAFKLHRIIKVGAGFQLQPMDGPIGVIHDQALANYLALPEERCAELLPALSAVSVQQ